MKRREVKEYHEKAVTAHFKNYLSLENKTLVVISNPDPPDAIVKIDENKTWIEITDAYLKREIAEFTTSTIADDGPLYLCQKKAVFALNPMHNLVIFFVIQ